MIRSMMAQGPKLCFGSSSAAACDLHGAPHLRRRCGTLASFLSAAGLQLRHRNQGTSRGCQGSSHRCMHRSGRDHVQTQLHRAGRQLRWCVTHASAAVRASSSGGPKKKLVFLGTPEVCPGFLHAWWFQRRDVCRNTLNERAWFLTHDMF